MKALRILSVQKYECVGLQSKMSGSQNTSAMHRSNDQYHRDSENIKSVDWWEWPVPLWQVRPLQQSCCYTLAVFRHLLCCSLLWPMLMGKKLAEMFFLWAVAANSWPSSSCCLPGQREEEAKGRKRAGDDPSAVQRTMRVVGKSRSRLRGSHWKEMPGRGKHSYGAHTHKKNYLGFTDSTSKWGETAICRYTIHVALLSCNNSKFFPATVVVRYTEMENTCYFSDQRTQMNVFFLKENSLYFHVNQIIYIFYARWALLLFPPLTETLSSFYLIWNIVIQLFFFWVRITFILYTKHTI